MQKGADTAYLEVTTNLQGNKSNSGEQRGCKVGWVPEAIERVRKE